MSSSASRAAKIAGTAVSRAHSARCSAPSPLRPPSHITKQPIILYVCLDQDDKADRLKADQGDSRGTPSGSRASINLGTDGYITLLPRHAPESEGPLTTLHRTPSLTTGRALTMRLSTMSIPGVDTMRRDGNSPQKPTERAVKSGGGLTVAASGMTSHCMWHTGRGRERAAAAATTKAVMKPATSPDPDDSPLAVCMRRAASVADPDGDEEGGEWNGITGAFTTAKNGHENASRDTAARCPAPRNGPSAASGRSTPTSTSGDVPASARRQPVRDTRSAASTRPLVSPMSNDRSSQGSDSEDAGVQLPPPERRQPTSKNSHSSTTPFTHSEQPTTADVAAGPQSESSESSGGVGLSTPESDSDSRSSTALHTTPLREADPTAIFQSASFNAATQRQHGRGPRTARTADLSNSFVHTQGGFPTFAEARWADPITAAQRSRRKRKSARIRAGRIGGEGEDESERAGEAEGRNALSVTRKGPQTAFPSVLDVVLPPGGPGLSWGDPEVVW